MVVEELAAEFGGGMAVNVSRVGSWLASWEFTRAATCSASARTGETFLRCGPESSR